MCEWLCNLHALCILFTGSPSGYITHIRVSQPSALGILHLPTDAVTCWISQNDRLDNVI